VLGEILGGLDLLFLLWGVHGRCGVGGGVGGWLDVMVWLVGRVDFGGLRGVVGYGFGVDFVGHGGGWSGVWWWSENVSVVDQMARLLLKCWLFYDSGMYSSPSMLTTLKCEYAFTIEHCLVPSQSSGEVQFASNIDGSHEPVFKLPELNGLVYTYLFLLLKSRLKHYTKVWRRI
jgi:hypothetical protein